MLARSAALGVRDVVIGGTSRSRLNVMANIVGKPVTAMFYEVKGHRPFPDDVQASGDVPYHFGYMGERTYGDATLKLARCSGFDSCAIFGGARRLTITRGNLTGADPFAFAIEPV